MTPSRRRAVAAAALSAAAAIGLLGACGIGPVARLDAAFGDALVRADGRGGTARDVVVVDIDETSLDAVGQWPWPRYRIAALVQRIAAAAPAAVALDLLLPETDRTSLAAIRDSYRRDFGVDIAIGGVPRELLDNDGWLGAVMAQTGAVGASYAVFDHAAGSGRPPRPGVAIDGRTDRLALREAPAMLTSADAIAAGTRTSGVVNAQPDADGVLRRLPLLLRHRGVIHPHLALAATMRAAGVASATVEAGADGLALRVGRHRVPIDADGNAMLRFEGPPPTVPSVSALALLDGSADPRLLRGKVVFVGTTAAGMNDFHVSPVALRHPGLKMLAALAQAVVDDRGIARPAWAPAATVAAAVAVGALLAALLLGGATIPMLAGTALAAAGAAAAGSAALFVGRGWLVPAAAPVLTAALVFAGGFAARYVHERRRSLARQRALENARQVTIESMASVAETRDPETGAHIKRTQNYVRAIARQLVRAGVYRDTLTPEFIELLYISAPLHDIGKVGIPDHILLKPGKLTDAEMVIMKEHAGLGARIVQTTSARIAGDNFLVIAGEIAATHHERWDGSGYPAGLAGHDIPLAGRIMAVADIYDALISRRCYKEPFTHAHATTLMRGMRGTTFDPAVLDAFFAIEAEIVDIAQRFRDEDESEESPKMFALQAACAVPADAG